MNSSSGDFLRAKEHTVVYDYKDVVQSFTAKFLFCKTS